MLSILSNPQLSLSWVKSNGQKRINDPKQNDRISFEAENRKTEEYISWRTMIS